MFTAPTLNRMSRAADIGNALAEAGSYLGELRAKAPADRGQGYEDDVRSAITFINEWDPVLTAKVSSERAKAALDLGRSGPVTIGAQVAGDSEYERAVAEHRLSSHAVSIEVRGSFWDPQMRALIDSDATTGNGAGMLFPQGNPILPSPRQRRLFLRDFLSVQGTGLSSVPYVREYTPTDTELGASAVAEGLAKPEVSMLFEPDDAPIRKIAAWIPVTTEALEDAETLEGYINTRLTYLIAIREEDEILNGSGVNPHLKGILNFSGLQTQSYVSGDKIATIGLAIGKVENVDGEVDAIAINPITFWTMVTTRFANQFDFGGGNVQGPYQGGPQNPWGVPTVRTRAVAADRAIVGSWALGATLFDRQETTIKVGNQHSDYFVSNKTVILAEERVGLAVHRPDLFCYATLA